tara:strand:- start:108 stop:764 length:657 start_codon:yes stop_codon:yes gene_type:complete
VDVESEKPKKKEWEDLNFKEKSLGCGVLFLIILVAAAYCSGGSDNPSTKEGRLSPDDIEAGITHECALCKNAAQPVKPGALELLDSELTLKVGKNDYRITGRIKNTSTKTISTLLIYFQLYDATGNQVGKVMDICCADVEPIRKRNPSLLKDGERLAIGKHANLLLPGETWNVIASDMGAVKRANKKAVSFRFDKITADLGGSSHKTVPLTNLPSSVR